MMAINESLLNLLALQAPQPATATNTWVFVVLAVVMFGGMAALVISLSAGASKGGRAKVYAAAAANLGFTESPQFNPLTADDQKKMAVFERARNIVLAPTYRGNAASIETFIFDGRWVVANIGANRSRNLGTFAVFRMSDHILPLFVAGPGGVLGSSSNVLSNYGAQVKLGTDLDQRLLLRAKDEGAVRELFRVRQVQDAFLNLMTTTTMGRNQCFHIESTGAWLIVCWKAVFATDLPEFLRESNSIALALRTYSPKA